MALLSMGSCSRPAVGYLLSEKVFRFFSQHKRNAKFRYKRGCKRASPTTSSWAHGTRLRPCCRTETADNATSVASKNRQPFVRLPCSLQDLGPSSHQEQRGPKRSCLAICRNGEACCGIISSSSTSNALIMPELDKCLAIAWQQSVEYQLPIECRAFSQRFTFAALHHDQACSGMVLLA